MAQITMQKYTLFNAFKECFYIVPDYQREYVWTDKEVNQLLEDINEQLDSSKSDYFIGTVLVSSSNDDNDHFDVVDGQQRLTTVFLILCAFRVLTKKRDQAAAIHDILRSTHFDKHATVETKIKLNLRYENANEVIEKIVEVNDTPQDVRAAIKSSNVSIHGSIEKILDAYELIYRFLLENYDDEAKLDKYLVHLVRNIVFIQISTKVSSALKIFETINERGVGLNPMDLLKNLLFRQVEQEQFSQLKDKWKEITSPLEQNKIKPLRFMRYFLMANYDFKSDRNDAIVREDEIYDWFSIKENAKIADYQNNPFTFVRLIKDNVNNYINFNEKRRTDGKQSFALESLKRLTGSYSLHYVLLLTAASLHKTLFDQFVAQIESFLFFNIFTKTPTNKLERDFSIWVGEVRNIADEKNHKEQTAKLNEFVKTRFAENIVVKTPELKDALKRLTLDSMRKYQIRYLLARLTQHVDIAFSGQKNRRALDPYYQLEIEHILPKKPDFDLLSRWQKKHPKLDYDEIMNLFGNLTLLEKPINIVASNDFYAKKSAKYAKSNNYLTRSLSAIDEIGQNTSISRINEKLISFKKWDAEDVERRQQMLISLALDVWKTTEITA